MHRRQLIATALAAPLALLLPAGPRPARAAGGRQVFAPGGAALGGTDPVAYFTQGEALSGRNRLRLKWGGAMWHFATPENLEAFEANPRAFVPRYGGWCALAMTEGRLAASIPEAWTLHQGRLYLNASLQDRARWREDIPGNILLANEHWQRLRKGAG